jgi:excisionase family DNA binding protein
MLKVSQVAERLNCSISTVHSFVESGKLGHHRCPGIRISEEQLAAFLDTTKQEQGLVSLPSSTSPRPRLKHITI